MIPVCQTTHGDGSDGRVPGNCLQACVASIFELDLADVPHFVENFPDRDDWWPRLTAWLENWGVVPHWLADDEIHPPDGLFIAGGETKSGNRHFVVARAGDSSQIQTVHDPSQGSGMASLDIVIFFQLADPSRVIPRHIATSDA